jgi:hypothetical protein
VWFPVILQMLGAGSLSLATARLLAAHLTAENQQELLAAGAGKSKRQIEELLVRYFPRPEVRPSVRKLQREGLCGRPRARRWPSLRTPPQGSGIPPLAGASPSALVPARRPVVRPLAPDRYEIRFTASAKTREKLRQAQDLLGHAIPSGDLAEVIDRALTVLLKDVARKKCAATDRPRTSRGTAPGSGRAHNAFESELFYGHGRPTERRTLPGKSQQPSPKATTSRDETASQSGVALVQGSATKWCVGAQV